MKNYMVKELMIPLSEYATVNVEANLYEAVLALEKAQAISTTPGIDTGRSWFWTKRELLLAK